MKYNTDVILISDARNYHLEHLTNLAIASLGVHSSLNVIVVESNKAVSYAKVKTIHPDQTFSYNAYLNIGAKQGNSDFILFANNDLIFIDQWNEKLIDEMVMRDVVSASPLCPLMNNGEILKIDSGPIWGHEINKTFCGWAFMWTRDFYEKVGGLDEDFMFWCSDHSAVEQLVANGKEHILVTSSLVQHLGGMTAKHLDPVTAREYTIGQVEKFNRKFATDLWKTKLFSSKR